MAEKLEIRLAFKPDGTVEVSTHGLLGAECLAETKDLESTLGRVTKRTRTSEAHATRTAATTSLRRT